MKGKLSRAAGLPILAAVAQSKSKDMNHVLSARPRRHIGALSACGAIAIGALASVASCKDPTGLDTAQATGGGSSSSSGGTATPFAENCPADTTWLPNTPSVPMFTPPPHPDTECPFYRGAYQNFLIATQPLSNGDPALVQYATLDDAFKSANKHYTRNTGGFTHVAGGALGTGRAWIGAIRQAGERQILIDRDNHTLYYGLHMNQAFVDFIKTNNLQIPGDPTNAAAGGILNVDPNLEFPAGLVEFKTAWKDIDPRDFPNGVVPPPGNAFDGDPGNYSNYITTTAWIPHLFQDPATKIIEEDPNNPVQRKMALVAIHCVYTLPGHPEFVWGSIQHVNTHAIDPAIMTYAGVQVLGAPDSQPDGLGPSGQPALPSDMDPQNGNVSTGASGKNYLLYTGGTAENASDGPGVYGNSALNFVESSQSFPGQVTNIYRMFPGSKSNELQPDQAVFSLNSNISQLWASTQGLDPNDKRMNYRLVAAVWMDKPQLFGLGTPDSTGKPQGMLLQNDADNPLVVGAQQNPPQLYDDINEGNFCGTPLDSTNTSGDSPAANGSNNTVPGCTTRADLLQTKDSSGAPFDPLTAFENHDPDVGGTDSPFSILGGEDRLSSMAMESFTQNGQFNNCFTCHNTQPITSNGTPASLVPPGTVQVLIPFAAKINVSHLFSEFILREQEEAALVAAGIN